MANVGCAALTPGTGSVCLLRARTGLRRRLGRASSSSAVSTHVYLFYLDESGVPRGHSGTYFVVGGIVLHEEDCYPFARSVERLAARSLPAAESHLELHASEMWSGRKTWSHVARETRHDLVRRTFDHLRTWRSADGRAPRYFAVAVHKPSFAGRDLVSIAHEELFLRLNGYIGRLHGAGVSHRSLVVADESQYESLVQSLVPRWKAAGTRAGRLHSLAEVPLYVDSKASRVIQAADFVAWSVWQYYQNGHTEHLQKIHSRFDSDGGIQHGLAHMVRGYTSCECAACRSRRVQVVRTTLTPHSQLRA